MVNLRVTTFTPPTSQQVADFKAYIGQSGTAADVFLAAILSQAMIHCGEWSDVSLLAGNYELIVSDRETNAPVRLYCTPSTITSVTDEKGNALEYTYTAGGKFVTIEQYSPYVKIVYATSVDTGTASVLLPKVWEYGKAKYEGRNEDAAAILMR